MTTEPVAGSSCDEPLDACAVFSDTDSKVLIIDDDDQFRRLMEKRLREEGYRHISSAGGGEEGLALAGFVKPDWIILDAVLPVADGFSVCEKLRRLKNLDATKIVMVTGSIKTIDTQRARHVGANAYTLKSVDCACILQAIKGTVE